MSGNNDRAESAEMKSLGVPPSPSTHTKMVVETAMVGESEEDERIPPCIDRDDGACHCLKSQCTGKGMLALLCAFVFAQTCVVGGLLGAVISTLEKRYNLNSSQTGLLPSINDFGFLAFSAIVASYGTTASKPRWLGTALICSGVGSLLFVIPQIYGGKYEAASPNVRQPLCGDPTVCTVGGGPANDAYAIFCIAMLFFAMGGSSLWILSPPYLTEIAPAASQTTYLATFYATAALGPAIGFGLAGVVLGSWVDVGVSPPEGLTPKSKDWVGAWWLAFILGALIAFAAVPWFFLFPRYPPGTKRMHELEVGSGKRKSVVEKAGAPEMEDSTPKADDEPIGFAGANARRRSIEEGAIAAERAKRQSIAAGTPMPPVPGVLATSIGESLRSCLTNAPFMLGTIAETCDGFIVAGFGTFLPKVVQNMYSVTASTASFSVGAVVIPGAAGGIFLGGYLCDKYRWNSRKKALFSVVAPAVSFVFLLCFAIICVSNPLAGANVRYNPDNNNNALVVDLGREAINAPCNAGCGCTQTTYAPVCDGHGISYVSACWAGCTNLTYGDAANPTLVTGYFGCACAASNPATLTPAQRILLTADPIKCEVGCNTLGIFLFFLFLAMLANFLNSSPTTALRFRVLPPNQKNFGSALAGVILRGVGTIPGPLIFGAAIDGVCSMWQYSCSGERGTCFEFSNENLRIRFLLLSLVPKGLAVLLYYLRYRLIPDDPAPAAVADPTASPAKPASAESGTRAAAGSTGGGGGSLTVELPIVSVRQHTPSAAAAAATDFGSNDLRSPLLA